jgi:FixJ family two-component response regulator
LENTKPRLAVVDDDAGIRNALGKLLRASGFDVEAFSSAEEFLEKPWPSPAACLILDLHLPGLSGFDLCERVHSSAGKAAVIFITAHDTPAARARAESLGAGYLVKPFVGSSLLDAVGRVLSKKES